MSHVDPGPLATYNSLLDPHLAGYFSNNRIKKHLRKSGLVTKKGHIVSESTFRLNCAKKQHRQHVQDLLAQAIVHKTLDMERGRQVNIKKKLEEIAKIELVRRVRCDLSHRGDEDVLPFLTPRSESRRRPGDKKSSSSGSKVTRHTRATSGGKTRTKHTGTGSAATPNSTGRGRPKSAPHGIRSHSYDSHASDQQIYAGEDDDLLVNEPHHASTNNKSRNCARKQGVAQFRKSHLEDKHLFALDQHALREITHSQHVVGQSPYRLHSSHLNPTPPITPRAVNNNNHQRYSGKRKQSNQSNRGHLMLHRSEPAMKHQERVQTMCHVKMHYFGSTLKLDYERMDPRDEIMVEQQHCGGNTLYIFKEKIVGQSDFIFTSRRHRGYPYSLTFYINGKIDCRVSTCCEYKHASGSRLGGHNGHFGVISVKGAAPCYRCQISASMAPKKPVQRIVKRRPHDVDVNNQCEVGVVQITERDEESYVKPLCDNDAIDGIGGENKERDAISESVIVPIDSQTLSNDNHVNSKHETGYESKNYEDDFEDSDKNSSDFSAFSDSPSSGCSSRASSPLIRRAPMSSYSPRVSRSPSPALTRTISPSPPRQHRMQRSLSPSPARKSRSPEPALVRGLSRSPSPAVSPSSNAGRSPSPPYHHRDAASTYRSDDDHSPVRGPASTSARLNHDALDGAHHGDSSDYVDDDDDQASVDTPLTTPTKTRYRPTPPSGQKPRPQSSRRRGHKSPTVLANDNFIKDEATDSKSSQYDVQESDSTNSSTVIHNTSRRIPPSAHSPSPQDSTGQLNGDSSSSIDEVVDAIATPPPSHQQQQILQHEEPLVLGNANSSTILSQNDIPLFTENAINSVIDKGVSITDTSRSTVGSFNSDLNPNHSSEHDHSDSSSYSTDEEYEEKTVIISASIDKHGENTNQNEFNHVYNNKKGNLAADKSPISSDNIKHVLHVISKYDNLKKIKFTNCSITSELLMRLCNVLSKVNTFSLYRLEV